MTFCKHSWAFASLVLCFGTLFGQTPALPPAIEVASVKPGDPGATSMGQRLAADQFSLVNHALMTLIENAYSLKDYQIQNAPPWLRSERWTLDIKTTGPTTFQEKYRLLPQLLADRFQLKVHRETRMQTVYSLVVAKGGPKLQKSQDDQRDSVKYGDGSMIAHKYDITRLAADLSGNLNMPVVDKTGLTGLYDFTLMWTPDPSQKEFGDVRDPANRPVEDPSRPMIYTAIQEQLGLKLEAEKGPVEVIVIDHVERPSQN